ncbi:hypothetical protein AHF37_10882 [Paragonimus kellicotti]|nr:hypothetical protein AHF37_10882 [Paragonimus kellicotti]
MLDFQPLHLRPCIERGGDAYCQRHVLHSFCANKSNECMCSFGHVAIYEHGFSFTCKPLLTDLLCRKAADCVHVTRSVCHPGIGLCICPSGYVFVPGLGGCCK